MKRLSIVASIDRRVVADSFMVASCHRGLRAGGDLPPQTASVRQR